MSIIKFINAGVSFAIELAMLALLAIGGYNIFDASQILRWFAAITLPLIAIMLWGYFIAPNNKHRLAQPKLCIAQILLFTIAAIIAYPYTNHSVIIVYVIFGYGSSILAWYIKQ